MYGIKSHVACSEAVAILVQVSGRFCFKRLGSFPRARAPMSQPVMMMPMPAQTFDTEVCAPPYSDFIRELYNSRFKLRPYIHSAMKKGMKKAMKNTEKAMKKTKKATPEMKKGRRAMKAMKGRAMKAMKGMKK